MNEIQPTPAVLFIGGFKGKVTERLFNDVVLTAIHTLNKPYVIYSGERCGLTYMIERVVNRLGLSASKIPANWDKDGSDAAYIRDRHISSVATHAVVFWDGFTKDVPYMRPHFKKNDVKTKLVIVEVLNHE